MKVRPLVPLLLLLSAGSSLILAGGGEGWEPDPRPVARTLVYQCPGNGAPGPEIVTRLGPGEMALWLDGDYLILSRVRSASGAKYQEGNTLFWLKGDEALFERGGEQYRGCRLVPRRAPWADARRRGVDFRAVGNEPGWHLEIHRGDRMVFVGDYGALRLEVAAPVEEVLDGVRIVSGTADSQDLRVEIVQGICVDSMVDESYPSQVLIQLDGRTYQGCGRDLETL
jgi:uncharacterized membrane protein/membrane-bound inhibitor of C-type lysozyme